MALTVYLRNWKSSSSAYILEHLRECFGTRYRKYHDKSQVREMVEYLQEEDPFKLPTKCIVPPYDYDDGKLSTLWDGFIRNKEISVRSGYNIEEKIPNCGQVLIDGVGFGAYSSPTIASENLTWLKVHLSEKSSYCWSESQRNLCAKLFLIYTVGSGGRECRQHDDKDIADDMTSDLGIRTTREAVSDYLMNCAFTVWKNRRRDFMFYYSSLENANSTSRGEPWAEPGTAAKLANLIDPSGSSIISWIADISSRRTVRRSPSPSITQSGSSTARSWEQDARSYERDPTESYYSTPGAYATEYDPSVSQNDPNPYYYLPSEALDRDSRPSRIPVEDYFYSSYSGDGVYEDTNSQLVSNKYVPQTAQVIEIALRNPPPPSQPKPQPKTKPSASKSEPASQSSKGKISVYKDKHGRLCLSRSKTSGRTEEHDKYGKAEKHPRRSRR